MQSSGGGSSGSAAVVRTSGARSANRARSPQVASAVIREVPSWTTPTAAVATDPPSRRTSTETVAGPGVDAET